MRSFSIKVTCSTAPFASGISRPSAPRQSTRSAIAASAVESNAIDLIESVIGYQA